MSDYLKEKWVELYTLAVIELSHSLMTGRILESREEIAKRIEKLKAIPGLHAQEIQALDDALRGLRSLEREEVRYAAEQQRETAQKVLDKLKAIQPAVQRLQESE